LQKNHKNRKNRTQKTLHLTGFLFDRTLRVQLLQNAMKTVILDTQESPNKWWALQDRRMRNYANKSLYTDKQQVRLERIRMALTNIVRGTVYEVSYGRRSAAVKVQNGALIADHKMLALLEQDWAAEGIYKKVSSQGFQYHMPI